MSSSSKDSSDKKRKKTSRPEVSPSKPSGSDVKKIKLDSRTGSDSRKVVVSGSSSKSPRSLFYAEEEEAQKRDVKSDLELFKDACEEIRLCVTKAKKMKETSSNDTEVLDEARVHGSLQFVTLKKLNRLAHMRCKTVRENTHEAKQKIDQFNLQLQNLLYEINHLQREITKCLEFTSKDEDIELVDVNDFYKDAPQEITKPEKTRGDEHELRLARLDWELEQRKRLAKKLKEALSQKDALSQDISKKKEHLDSLQPKLNAILKETKPVQEELGMPFDERRQQHKMARFLPRPLYVLYMQASAYSQACDKDMTVNIVGEIEEVTEIEPDYIAKLFDDSESEAEAEEQEEGKKVSKHRRKTAGDKLDQKRKKLVKPHPLTIDITLNCPDNNCLQLTFSYLVALEIITVRLEATVAVATSISGGDLLSEEMLLNCLYPGDIGITSPNPTNNYALEKLGIDQLENYVNTGRPYKWAQWLAGIELLTPDADDDDNGAVLTSSNSVSASRMEEVIKKLRGRVASRISLQRQLGYLEKGTVSVSPEFTSAFPNKISSGLKSWKRSTYEDYTSAIYTEAMQELSLISPADLFFKAAIGRGSAKLEAQIAISPDYPHQPPLVAVSITQGTTRTANTDDNVKMLEAEVNLYFEDLMATKSHDQLLTNQMQRLLMCFDVYLETGENSVVSGPREFPQEKLYQRTKRGRHRARPYYYNTLRAVFSQRKL